MAWGKHPSRGRKRKSKKVSRLKSYYYSIIFIGGVPAIYQLGLMTTPKEDFTKWLAFTAVNAFFGQNFLLRLGEHSMLIRLSHIRHDFRHCIEVRQRQLLH